LAPHALPQSMAPKSMRQERPFFYICRTAAVSSASRRR
jgi:hypothetical protein